MYRKEPEHVHGKPDKTAVLLVNLGTPDAPTSSAVRRYLKEFLSDSRVVEIPRLVWLPILYGLILPLRAKQSAAKYAAIWTKEGSPLKVHTQKQAVLLRGYLGERGYDVQVSYAMRYGTPSLPQVLQKLQHDGCTRILVLPLYPQYSAAATATVFDATFAHYAAQRNMPELRLVKHYHDHASYIEALSRSVHAHWEANGRPDKLVMSFHGIPKRSLLLGDPYHCECQKTGRLLAQRLGLGQDQYLVTFQSRFGKAEWLQPYTAPKLRELAKGGTKRVDVICPGFVADCLETIEEIGIEAKQEFLTNGGKEFHLIPCLNEDPDWIRALADIAEQHLLGWPVSLNAQEQELRKKEAEISRKQALQRGAAK